MKRSHELLYLMLDDQANVGAVLSAGIKEEYIEPEISGTCPERDLFSSIIEFHIKYNTKLKEDDVLSFLSARLNVADRIKAALLLYESLVREKVSATAQLVLDDIRDAYAKSILHKRVASSVDHLVKNNVAGAVSVLQSALTDVAAVTTEDASEIDVRDSVSEVVDDYKAVKLKLSGAELGLTTGFPSFDRMTGGLKPGELDIIMAGSSHGKSICMMNIGYHVQAVLNKNVVFFSLELPRKQLLRRYFSLASGLVCNDLRDGTLSAQDEAVYKDTLKRVQQCAGRFYIIDQPGMTAQHVEAKIGELKQVFQIDLVIVDYLGLMKSLSPTGVGWQDISNTALDLRRVGRQHKVPILTAMQVKQESQKSAATTHAMTDIALSFQVIYHADTVMSLKPASQDVFKSGMSVCELNASISKCRDGNRGDFVVDAAFDRMQMRERI